MTEGRKGQENIDEKERQRTGKSEVVERDI